MICYEINRQYNQLYKKNLCFDDFRNENCAENRMNVFQSNSALRKYMSVPSSYQSSKKQTREQKKDDDDQENLESAIKNIW